MKYRTALKADINSLVELRKKQLIDEGISPSVNIDQELYDFFINTLNDETLVEWLVEIDGRIIATAGIIFYKFPPSYTNKTGQKGYITNMYTAPAYRGKGIASSLLSKLAEEAKKRNVNKLWLGASKLGKPVYLKYGFIETNEWLELDTSN